MISFKCDKCGSQFRISNEHAGEEIICKNCRIMLTVPEIRDVQAFPFDTSYDAGQVFMARNYELFEALLKHEREAPPVELAG